MVMLMGRLLLSGERYDRQQRARNPEGVKHLTVPPGAQEYHQPVISKRAILAGAHMMSDIHAPGDKRPTFEETWPRYEFAEMVRIGLLIGDWIARLPRRRTVPVLSTVEPSRKTGPAAPAT
jgi:hypothetical protein